MVTISKFSYDNPRFIQLLNRKGNIPPEVETTVKEVLEQVKNHGDKALYDYMKKFDHVDMEKIGLSVSSEEFALAKKNVTDEFKETVKKACDNLFRFHRRQLPSGYTEKQENGVILERRYSPLERVAVTVPGNMAPLISTLYMNLIPAIVAGVPDIYILTKPRVGYSVIQYTETALKKNADHITRLAEAEGMTAHALAVKVRAE